MAITQKAVAPSNATKTATLTVTQIKQQQEMLAVQLAEAAMNEVGSYEEAIESLKSDFAPLAERFTTIKAAYPQSVAPWSTFANRNNIADWLRAQAATNETSAFTTEAIVEGTGIADSDVARLLKKGSGDGRSKLFKKVGADSWFVKS